LPLNFGQEALSQGKAMIVCMSRRICVALYHEIQKIRPQWFGDNDDEGIVKVVMTGSASDSAELQPHVRNGTRRKELAERFKKPADPFRIVIVRNMWLTGFDAPSLNTLYIDKPMKGADLMQAIARVNRVFKDKPGGLVVDYLGIADQLKDALGTYTASKGRGKPTEIQAEAVSVMLEKYELCCDLFHGFKWDIWKTGTGPDRMRLIVPAMEHVLEIEDGKARFSKVSLELAKAFALASPHEKTVEIRDDVAFFQTIRTVLNKNTKMTGRTHEEMEFALQQLVSRAVASEGMLDVFQLAGLNKPDISVLSDEFLLEVKNLPQKNVAVELLAKLLGNKIKRRAARNIVQARSFAELLETSIQKYQNRAIETAQIIEELISLAKEMNEAKARGEQLNLTEDEEAFYDALSVNDSAVKVLGDKILCEIARDLKKSVKENLTVDWQYKEGTRAQLRLIVKRILKKYGYPPDKQDAAVTLVLKQTETLCESWATSN
jgi:type I restriction enzyme, R subunit